MACGSYIHMTSPRPAFTSGSPIVRLKSPKTSDRKVTIKSLVELKADLNNDSSHAMEMFRIFKEQIHDGSSKIPSVVDFEFESEEPLQDIKRAAESFSDDGKLFEALFVLELCYNQLHQAGLSNINPAWLAKCLWGMTVTVERVESENILKKYINKIRAAIDTIDNLKTGSIKTKAWSTAECLTALSFLQEICGEYRQSIRSCAKGMAIMEHVFPEPEKYQVYGRCFALMADSTMALDDDELPDAFFWYKKASRIYSRETYSFIDRSKDLEYGNLVWSQATALYLTKAPSASVLITALTDAYKARKIFMDSKDVLLKDEVRRDYEKRISCDIDRIKCDLYADYLMIVERRESGGTKHTNDNLVGNEDN